MNYTKNIEIQLDAMFNTRTDSEIARISGLTQPRVRRFRSNYDSITIKVLKQLEDSDLLSKSVIEAKATMKEIISSKYSPEFISNANNAPTILGSEELI